MQIALKIDVDTYRGTREGVPALVAALKRHHADATFLFSLGRDHTGRAMKRVFRPGFFSKVSRTSVVEHYGIKTLLYGTLLPGPDIGKECADVLRATRDAGFEVGIHTWDHVKWQDGVSGASADWTRAELRKAVSRYVNVFGEPPSTHGAAGWQMNAHAFGLLDEFQFNYASDTRGTSAFLPVVDGKTLSCPQIPSTLPTLDELLGLNGLDASNVAQHILAITDAAPDALHVYTLHAELEGMKLLPVFETLLAGWRARGATLVATRTLAAQLDRTNLPHHAIEYAEVPGRSGTLALQGKRIN